MLRGARSEEHTKAQRSSYLFSMRNYLAQTAVRGYYGKSGKLASADTMLRGARSEEHIELTGASSEEHIHAQRSTYIWWGALVPLFVFSA